MADSLEQGNSTLIHFKDNIQSIDIFSVNKRFYHNPKIYI